MHSHPTQVIIEHHFNSFIKNDLEALMSNYTEDSKVIQDGKIYRHTIGRIIQAKTLAEQV